MGGSVLKRTRRGLTAERPRQASSQKTETWIGNVDEQLLGAPDAYQPILGYFAAYTLLDKHQLRPILEVRTERGAIYLAGTCYGRPAWVQARNMPTKPNKFAF